MISKINWKVRMKNKWFIAQIILSILTPVLAYMGLTIQDMTSWKILGDTLFNALSNPYILGLVAVSVFNALNDPTTHGLADSEKALTYEEPN